MRGRKAEGGFTRPLPFTPMLDLTFQVLTFQLLFFCSGVLGSGADPPPPDHVAIHVTAGKAAIPLQQRRLRLRAGQGILVGVPGKGPMSPLEAKVWLRDMYQDAEKEGRADRATVVIHFRPDVEMNDLLSMVRFCEAAGFKNVKLQAKAK